MTAWDVLIIGGGAAGFFTAINTAEANPSLKIAILERGKEVLTKVKISGGGRCNVTHAQFIPEELSENYPRGKKELLGPFHNFMTGDTITWFQERGVQLKIEEDGRMFPTTNSSQTIIDCFTAETDRLGIRVLKGQSVKQIRKTEEGFELVTPPAVFKAKKVVIATGSNPKVWKILEALGHSIVPPVPSLFTFNIKDKRIADLPGLATEVSVEVLSEKGKGLLASEGPLLITHWGMSGPAILKLSAWGARLLEPTKYHFTIRVNWLHSLSVEEALEQLLALKLQNPKQTLQKYAQFELPKRLWQSLLVASGIEETQIWADVSKKQLANLSKELTAGIFQVEGKSTFKEEFVTAGGIKLKEVNFKTFESKIIPNLYFAGEVLNIDAITGGFNFQNAWTGGYLVAKAITL
ncbi:MAG: aminoacetone oxidase family FAD-binding enzyme [Flavobacteriaceae bacterium]|nr:aminoacetone oxidase family FAD-binding enzyme [Flavobacteriaceae bacterium]